MTYLHGWYMHVAVRHLPLSHPQPDIVTLNAKNNLGAVCD